MFDAKNESSAHYERRDRNDGYPEGTSRSKIVLWSKNCQLIRLFKS
ncbi:hypothetical protein [Coleofasciculus sp. E2-BRE-01]